MSFKQASNRPVLESASLEIRVGKPRCTRIILMHTTVLYVDTGNWPFRIDEIDSSYRYGFIVCRGADPHYSTFWSGARTARVLNVKSDNFSIFITRGKLAGSPNTAGPVCLINQKT